MPPLFRGSTLSTTSATSSAIIGITALWTGVLLGAHFYPTEYDWRYMTLSRLLAPDHNPAGHAYAALGVIVCALCELIWATDTLRRLSQARHAGQRGAAGLTAMQFGMAGMVCAAVPANWLLAFPKEHEALAAVAFTGLSLGMLQVGFCSVERTLAGSERGSARPRVFALLLAAAAVTPIVLAGLTQAYVFYAHPELPWVGASWRARGIPAYDSLAFWEWITCAVLSVYMFIIATLHRSSRVD